MESMNGRLSGAEGDDNPNPTCLPPMHVELVPLARYAMSEGGLGRANMPGPGELQRTGRVDGGLSWLA